MAVTCDGHVTITWGSHVTVTWGSHVTDTCMGLSLVYVLLAASEGDHIHQRASSHLSPQSNPGVCPDSLRQWQLNRLPCTNHGEPLCGGVRGPFVHQTFTWSLPMGVVEEVNTSCALGV